MEVDEVVFSLAKTVEENRFNFIQGKQHAETRKGNWISQGFQKETNLRLKEGSSSTHIGEADCDSSKFH